MTLWPMGPQPRADRGPSSAHPGLSSGMHLGHRLRGHSPGVPVGREHCRARTSPSPPRPAPAPSQTVPREKEQRPVSTCTRGGRSGNGEPVPVASATHLAVGLLQPLGQAAGEAEGGGQRVAS